MPLELRLSSRTLLCALLACLATLALLGLAAARSAQAAPTPNSVLILGSTVDSCSATDDSGGTCSDPQSLEEQQAKAAGFTSFTVATDTEWKAMTTADFEQYQLIIFGDPASTSCDTMDPESLAALTAPAWEAAVMDTGGNKVLMGATPTKHYLQDTKLDGPELEEQSLAYAGAQSGATGVYIDLDCSFDGATPGTAIPFLDGLSSQNGTHMFQVMGYDPNPPPSNFNPVTACDTSVNIVATTPLTTGLTDTSLSNWDCSVQEAFTSFPSDYTPLVLAPNGSGFPSEYCANDVDTSEQACGSPYILVSGGGVTLSSEIGLSPASQTVSTSPVSPGTATVTASVTKGGVQESGKAVTFTVTNGPDQGQTQTVNTDSNGQAQFTVDNSGVSGVDSVTASFIDDSGNEQKANASIDFQGPANVSVTPNSLSGTQGTALGDPVVASFTDPSGQVGAWTTRIDWGDGSTSTGTVSPTGTANQYNLNADHTYATQGTYTVTITVQDASNSADTTTVTTTATIGPGQLAVHAQPVNTTEGLPGFSGTVATFTNTDDSTLPSSYTATIDWGDGSSPSTGTVTAVTGTPGSFIVTGATKYADAGSYTITVTVTGGDVSTATAQDQSTATVVDAPITVTADTISPTTGTPFSGQVATFTDGDTLTPASDYTATIDWKDGTTTTGTISGSDGSFVVDGTHTYTTTGTFPLTVTVQETDDPSASGTGTGSASAGDAAFTVTGRGTLMLPSESFDGTLATVKYGNHSALAGSFAAKINWGDGSTGTGTLTGSAGSFNVTAHHTFAGTGPYTVRVTVTDPAAKTGTASTTILVPSSLSSLSIPGWISARALLCGVKRHTKCTGLPITGSFRSSGGAVWDVSISKSGHGPIVLGQLTRKVTAGSVRLVFKVTNRSLARRLYGLVKRHKLNELSVQQVFTNAAGARSQTTLFARVTK